MKVDQFTGETYHLGRWHVSDCAIFQEPDSEMGLRACNCDDLLNPEEDIAASCKCCDGIGSISYNPNLNPSVIRIA